MLQGVYVCILFDNGIVVEARSVEAANPDSARAIAVKLMDKRPACTNAEIWSGGERVRTIQRAKTARATG